VKIGPVFLIANSPRTTTNQASPRYATLTPKSVEYGLDVTWLQSKGPEVGQ
jgi:hypothetical protein